MKRAASEPDDGDPLDTTKFDDRVKAARAVQRGAIMSVESELALLDELPNLFPEDDHKIKQLQRVMVGGVVQTRGQVAYANAVERRAQERQAVERAIEQTKAGLYQANNEIAQARAGRVA